MKHNHSLLLSSQNLPARYNSDVSGSSMSLIITQDFDSLSSEPGSYYGRPKKVVAKTLYKKLAKLAKKDWHLEALGSPRQTRQSAQNTHPQQFQLTTKASEDGTLTWFKNSVLTKISIESFNNFETEVLADWTD